MYQNKADYDRGVNTFSPEGRLFQVEYATESIKLGSTAIGIQTTEGIVLAAELRLSSPLLIPKSVQKIMEIDSHIACVHSGLISDAKMLVEHARVEGQQHRFVFNEAIGVESLTQAVGDMALRFGEDGASSAMSRPFGVALLIAGIDSQKGPQLFFTDPSGTLTQYSAKAIGSASEVAQVQLKDEYNPSMTLDDASILAIKLLKEVMEEKINGINCQMALITKEGGYRLLKEEDILSLLSSL